MEGSVNRRDFLKLTGVGAAGFAAWGCETDTITLEPVDGGAMEQAPQPEPRPEVDAGMGRDASTIDAGPPTYTIHGAFVVILNDSTCSRHTHSANVSAAVYVDDTPVHFLGGSHELVFKPSELVTLQEGAKIPFATIGEGPGHGHCGTAWRESVGPPDPDPNHQISCATLGSALCIS